MTELHMHGATSAILATIGYQSATIEGFLDALAGARIQTVVDVRAVAASRRPGFSKTALGANLATRDIQYVHLRKLGTPADGRAAARAGRHAEMHRIFREQLVTEAAQVELTVLEEMVRSGSRVCLLCYEDNPAECHRRIVAEALADRMPVDVLDLHAYTAER